MRRRFAVLPTPRPRGGRTRHALGAFAAVVWLGVAGCSGNEEASPPPGDAGNGAMVGGSCVSEARADTYAVGLEKVSASGKLHVTLLDMRPAPPQKGDNAWTIAVRDDAGAPVSDAALTLTPFMPDHAHGSAVTPVVAPTDENGNYSVDEIYLPMAGYWELTVRLGEEQVVFGVCIEG